MSDKKGIEKHCEYLESKIRKKQFKIDELREQLQQRDEVIDEAMRYIDSQLLEISKHQYAIGTKRLNKIKDILNKGSESHEN